MKKILSLFFNFLLVILTIYLFTKALEVENTFKDTLNYLIKIIIPSLFPYMIFINFILLSNSLDYLALLLNKVFKINGYYILILIGSLIGGYPYNAILINSFLKDNKINNNEAYKLLVSSFFPSISFSLCLYRLDVNFIYILLSLYLSSLIMFLFAFKKDKESTKIKIKQNIDYLSLYYKVMNNSLKGIFTMCFAIIFFNLLMIPFNNLIVNENIKNLISGLLEFSSSSIMILKKPFKTFTDYFILNIIISFSSFSIIMQSMYYLKEIKITNLMKAKLVICLLSSIIFSLFYLFCIKN